LIVLVSSIFVDVHGSWVITESISTDFTNTESNFVVHIEPCEMLVFERLLFVKDGGKLVHGTGDLENFAHLVLEKLLWVAIVVEAEVGEIVHVLFNVTVIIKHIVGVIHQHENLNEVGKVQIFQFQFNVIEIQVSFSSETLFWNFVVIVRIESSSPAL